MTDPVQYACSTHGVVTTPVESKYAERRDRYCPKCGLLCTDNLGDPVVDVLATSPWYADHLRPTWEALGSRRGFFFTGPLPGQNRKRHIIVASEGDRRVAHKARRPIIFMEHGVGYSYSNHHPAYAGGANRDGVKLFISPNDYVARPNALAHPNIPQVIVGSPRLDPWWNTKPTPTERPVIVLSFHWDCRISPEAQWTYPYYKDALPKLRDWAWANGYDLVGHGHPRASRFFHFQWAALGIPHLEHFDDVMKRGSLYIADTTSTLYEFAATGRPVLVLNAPWYRREVDHGLRFWRDIPGLQVDRPEDLILGVKSALADPEKAKKLRKDALASCFPVGRDRTATERAVRAINEYLSIAAMDPV